MSKLLFTVFAVLTVVIFLGFLVAFSSNSSNGNVNANTPPTGQYQEISIKATGAGTYDKPYLTVKKGIPVKLNFTATKDSGCGKMLLLRDFRVQLLSTNEQTVTAYFTPQQTGKFEYSCSMRMFRGTLEVIN